MKLRIESGVGQNITLTRTDRTTTNAFELRCIFVLIRKHNKRAVVHTIKLADSVRQT